MVKLDRPKSSNPVYAAVNFGLRGLLRRIPPSSLVERAALWWGYRYQPAPAFAELRSGARLAVTENDHLQILLYYLGTFEPQSIRLMKRVVRPGTIALDVGANIGFFTVEAAMAVGPSGRVIAIEAFPPHARTVRRNVELNSFCNVDVISSAVGEADGVATLTLPTGANHGMFTLGTIAGADSGEVPVKRIDDILEQQGVRSVDFIKMDIEGSELRALKGAANTLRSNHPPILIELNEAALIGCGTSSSEVKELLYSLGYKGWLVGRGRLVPIPASQRVHDCDECFFTADSSGNGSSKF
jgi:FkbM family methyltransferase